MNDEEYQSEKRFRVVLNHEEQYSIWPSDMDVPAGWRCEGTEGTKQECLEHIGRVWTDMRPLSLRQRMAQRAEVEPVFEPDSGKLPKKDAASPNELVARLCEGDHPVEVILRPESTVTAFKDCVEHGFVLIRFTDTRGGTEVGVKLDHDSCNYTGADYNAHRGSVRLTGRLTLNFTPIRCIADIDIATLTGHGRLELLQGG